VLSPARFHGQQGDVDVEVLHSVFVSRTLEGMPELEDLDVQSPCHDKLAGDVLYLVRHAVLIAIRPLLRREGAFALQGVEDPEFALDVALLQGDPFLLPLREVLFGPDALQGAREEHRDQAPCRDGG
jgi:hypothetical protein